MAMNTASTGNSQKTDSVKVVAIATAIGNAIESYDFLLYGLAAGLVFGPLFFPTDNPLTGTLIALATFGVAFIARPFGGLLTGHLGDRLGRRDLLVAVLLLMGFGTICIGLLPTYERIGIWAPILLVVLRFVQGLALGGEYGGGVALTAEHAPVNRRGFYVSWQASGAPVGYLLATGAFALVSTLPEEQFLAWGWRIPFLLSILLVGLGLYVRLRILESQAFEHLQETNTVSRAPIADLLRSNPKDTLLSIGVRLAESVLYYVVIVFAVSYATEQSGLASSSVLLLVAVATAISFFTIIGFGALSDRLSRKTVYMGGAAFGALVAFPFFWLIDTGVPVLVGLAFVLGLAVGQAAMLGPSGSLYSEIFPTKARYTGISFAREIGGVIGGFSPFIVAALLAWSGGGAWPVSLYLVIICLFSLTSTYLLSATFRRDFMD